MEKIETINQFLRDTFGIDTVTTQPMYRVVWADDQFEKRLTNYTDSGIFMLQGEVRELPKYPWCKGFYVLEMLQPVPEANIKELAGRKIDYNILHKFMGANELPVAPASWACKFVIDAVNAAMGRGSLNSYIEKPKAPISNPREDYEDKKARLDQIENELYGDESGLGGETIKMSGSAIIVPGQPDKEN